MPAPNGEEIKKRRIERELGLKEFARSCGIDPGNLSRIERGLAGAHMATLRRIAHALGVTVADISGTE